jgi:hypothetical protein
MRKATFIMLGAICVGGASLAWAQTAPTGRPITPVVRMAPAQTPALDRQIEALKSQVNTLQLRVEQSEKTIASLKSQVGTVASQFSIAKGDLLVLNTKTDATNAALVSLRTAFGNHKHYAFFEGLDAQGNHNVIKYLATTLDTTSCVKVPGQFGTAVWKCTAP